MNPFLLVIGAGTFVAGWLVAGPVRIAYAGWQIALALNYTLLYSERMTIELDPIWDRLVDIFVGIVAMRADFVWWGTAGKESPQVETQPAMKSRPVQKLATASDRDE